ncbi:MAG: LysM peptidoglycan-binding domain-containing protein, partial [Actinomycetota bacterium]
MSRRLAALAGLLALVIGVPLMLLETSGAPGLDGLPDLEGLRRAVDLRWIPAEWAIRVLALAAWALWAYLLLAVLLRIAGAIEARFPARGRLWEASEAFTWAPVKLLVDLSLGAILLSGTVGHDPARAAARPSSWSATAASQMAAIRNEAGPAVQPDSVQPLKKGVALGERDQAGAATNGDYVVRPGESLWTIAERELKDPYRWKEIWRLNEGRAMPDGERLSRPGFVRPGWSLRLPTAPDSDRTRDECENGGQATREAPSATNRDRPHRRHAEHAPKVDRQSHANEPSPEPSADEHRHPSQHDRVELPSGTAVAISFAAGFISAIGMRELAARR